MNVNIDFFDLLLKPEEFSNYYGEVKSKFSGAILYSSSKTTIQNKSKKENYVIHDIPNYLNTTPAPPNKLKILSTYQGSLIKINKYNSYEEYLKNKFSVSRRYNFRTCKKRLETCFNISYKTYYGEMEKEEYDRLFKRFPKMIEERFNVLQKEHYDLAVWDRYQKNGFSLINKRKAVLFVIYDNDTPISISFNPILEKVMYGFVRAFDINYSKFYLGFTDLNLQLQWCYKNKIEIFDLLKGTFPYKEKYIDQHYSFQKHIVHHNALFSTTQALFYKYKTLIKYWIIKFLFKLKTSRFSTTYTFQKSGKTPDINENYEVQLTQKEIPKDYSKINTPIKNVLDLRSV